MDGDPNNVKIAQDFYSKQPSLKNSKRSVFINARITAENVDELISSNGFSGEIDVLVTDIDGTGLPVSRCRNIYYTPRKQKTTLK